MTQYRTGFTDQELDVLLPFLVHEGFLKQQKLPNGKVYYKRTRQKIPTPICDECKCDKYQHYGECSKAYVP